MNINLKDFNLERALAGDPVIARNGCAILNLAYLPDAPDDQKIACVFISPQGIKSVYLYYIKGNMWSSKESDIDLFMAPIEKEYWVASGVGAASGRIRVTDACNTKEQAQDLVNSFFGQESGQIHKITRLE